MTGTTWLDAEEARAWRAFVTAAALVDRRLDQQLKESVGISHLQYGILAQLSECGDHEMRMTELAGSVLNSKSGLTYQISQLKKAGLVRRRPCDTSSLRGVAGDRQRNGNFRASSRSESEAIELAHGHTWPNGA